MKWITNAFMGEEYTYKQRGFIIGIPGATDTYTVGELVEMNMIGVYAYGEKLIPVSGCSISIKSSNKIETP